MISTFGHPMLLFQVPASPERVQLVNSKLIYCSKVKKLPEKASFNILSTNSDGESVLDNDQSLIYSDNYESS